MLRILVPNPFPPLGDLRQAFLHHLARRRGVLGRHHPIHHVAAQGLGHGLQALEGAQGSGAGVERNALVAREVDQELDGAGFADVGEFVDEHLAGAFALGGFDHREVFDDGFFAEGDALDDLGEGGVLAVAGLGAREAEEEVEGEVGLALEEGALEVDPHETGGLVAELLAVVVREPGTHGDEFLALDAFADLLKLGFLILVGGDQDFEVAALAEGGDEFGDELGVHVARHLNRDGGAVGFVFGLCEPVDGGLRVVETAGLVGGDSEFAVLEREVDAGFLGIVLWCQGTQEQRDGQGREGDHGSSPFLSSSVGFRGWCLVRYVSVSGGAVFTRLAGTGCGCLPVH